MDQLVFFSLTAQQCLIQYQLLNKKQYFFQPFIPKQLIVDKEQKKQQSVQDKMSRPNNNYTDSFGSKFSINFSILKQVEYGWAVYVIGNIKELGSWAIQSAFRLQWNTGNQWKGTINVSKERVTQLEFEYVVAPWHLPSAVLCFTQKQFIRRVIPIKTKKKVSQLQISIHKKVNFGQAVYLVGSIPLFGQWDIKNSPRLQWHKGDIWKLSLKVPQKYCSLAEFQFVVSDFFDPQNTTSIWQSRYKNRQSLLNLSKQNIQIASSWDQSHIFLINIQIFKQKPKIKEKVKMKATNSEQVTIKSTTYVNKQGQEQIKISIAQEQIFNDKKPEQIFNMLEDLQTQNKNVTRIICQQIMNKPLTDEQVKADADIKAQFQQIVKKSDPEATQTALEQVLLTLHKQMFDAGIGVTFEQKSSVRTQIGIKALTTGFMMHQVKCVQVLQKQECDFTFQQIKQDQKRSEQFEIWYKQKISRQTGIKPQEITIHKITNCCIKVEWSTTNGAGVQQAAQKNKKLQLHPYLNNFHLSSEDFDPKGNIQFNQTKDDVQRRGKWPYYQPVKCKRYGLKVAGRYDNGDDKWLQMKNVPGQWAVAFHGVNYPDASVGSSKVMNSIMNGIGLGTMLQAGAAQACSGHTALNKPGQKVGRGIYCSPHFQVCLNGYTRSVQINNKGYRLIFQCRVNPDAIKIAQNNTYWVINDSKNIRPYGAILVKDSVVAQIPSVTSQFKDKKQFKWSDFEHQIITTKK